MSGEVITTGWVPINADYAPLVTITNSNPDSTLNYPGRLVSSGYAYSDPISNNGRIFTLGFDPLGIQDMSILLSIEAQVRCYLQSGDGGYMLGMGVVDSVQGGDKWYIGSLNNPAFPTDSLQTVSLTTSVADSNAEVQDDWWPAVCGMNGGFMANGAKPALAFNPVEGNVSPRWYVDWIDVRFTYQLSGTRELYVHNEGIWKTVEGVMTKDAGVWKPTTVSTHNLGSWKEVFA